MMYLQGAGKKLFINKTFDGVCADQTKNCKNVLVLISTVMVGSLYGFLCAGWCTTSVFLC